MRRRFVVISGLPGSGKTTVARQLAPLLQLLVIDKDDILDSLFESRGVGDAAWRRALSRESDDILQTEALASNGAILVSHWRLPRMPIDSGTPVEWLSLLSPCIVHVHCRCHAEAAASRVMKRRRHPGHLDAGRSAEETLTSIQELARYGELTIGRRIDVDTMETFAYETLALEIHEAFRTTV